MKTKQHFSNKLLNSTIKKIKKTSYNMGFARCGVEGNLRKFSENTRKNFSIF